MASSEDPVEQFVEDVQAVYFGALAAFTVEEAEGKIKFQIQIRN